MTTIRRVSRRRIQDHDPILRAWDNAMPPPDEARDPERRGDLIAAIYFRWAERRPAWVGPHHPHLGAWLAMLDSTP